MSLLTSTADSGMLGESTGAAPAMPRPDKRSRSPQLCCVPPGTHAWYHEKLGLDSLVTPFLPDGDIDADWRSGQYLITRAEPRHVRYTPTHLIGVAEIAGRLEDTLVRHMNLSTDNLPGALADLQVLTELAKRAVGAAGAQRSGGQSSEP